MKRLHFSGVREAGFSLAEVLVAITLFVAVSAITGTLIVQANQTTRRATAAATTQSQLLDVVQRMTRDVAVAEKITIAEPNRLETLSIRDMTPTHPSGRSVRTLFEYSATTGEIRSKTTYGEYGAPGDPGDPAPAVDMTSGSKVVAGNVMALTSPETLLAYVQGAGTGLEDIARVKVNLKAVVKDRAKPLTLTTSMATRLKPAPSGNPPQLPPLLCPAVSSTDPATGLPRQTKNSVALDWAPAQYGALTFKITRLPGKAWTAGGLMVDVNTGFDVDTSSFTSLDDFRTSLSNTGLLSGTEYTYTIIPQGPGGSPAGLCPTAVTTKMDPAVLGGSITPNEHVYDAARTYKDATLTWPQVRGATGYTVERDGVYLPDIQAPAGLTSQVSYVDLSRVPGRTYTYRVFATNLYELRGEVASNSLALTPDPLPPIVGAYPVAPPFGSAATYATNALSWHGEQRVVGVGQGGPAVGPVPGPSDDAPTLHHYVVTRAFTLAGAPAPLDAAYGYLATVNGPTLTYNDAAAALGYVYYYKVTAYSTLDPRPKPVSDPSVLGNKAVQYPDTPTTDDFGKGGSGTSSGNSLVSGAAGDGNNHVAWTAGRGATSYSVDRFQGGGAVTTLGPTTDLYLNDTTPLRGTRFDYMAFGANNCHDDDDDPRDAPATWACESPIGTSSAKIYQRPDQPNPTITAPTLTTNSTTLTFPRGDGSQPATARFCDSVDHYDAQGQPVLTCTYSIKRFDENDGGRFVTAATTVAGTTFTSTPPFDNANDDTLDGVLDEQSWGGTYDYQVQTANPGGVSGWSVEDTALTFPGPFRITDANMVDGYWQKINQHGAGEQGQNYSMRLDWAASTGTSIKYKNQVGNAAETVYPAAPNGRSSLKVRPTAGSRYNNLVTAMAANLRERPVIYRTQTAPSPISSIEMVSQCYYSVTKAANVMRMLFNVDTRRRAGILADEAHWYVTKSTVENPTEADRVRGAVHDVPASTVSVAADQWVSDFMYYTVHQDVNIRVNNTLAGPVSWLPYDHESKTDSVTISFGYYMWITPPGGSFDGPCKQAAWTSTGGVNYAANGTLWKDAALNRYNYGMYATGWQNLNPVLGSYAKESAGPYRNTTSVDEVG